MDSFYYSWRSRNLNRKVFKKVNHPNQKFWVNQNWRTQRLKNFPVPNPTIPLNYILVELKWAYSLFKANQLIKHQHILVDNKIVTQTNTIVYPNMVIKPSKKGLKTIQREYVKVAKKIQSNIKKPMLQSWIRGTGLVMRKNPFIAVVKD